MHYEAHLECPGFSFYGNHAAGIPFALIGHNRFAAWGLTMFENDDVDFFREKVNPEDPNQVWVDDHWEPFKVREEVIRVKGEDDVSVMVRMTRHGPVISDVSTKVSAVDNAPVSVWWAAAKLPFSTIKAVYAFAHAESMDDAREAAAQIDAPGLNVMYGDRDGNIAWWASCMPLGWSTARRTCGAIATTILATNRGISGGWRSLPMEKAGTITTMKIKLPALFSIVGGK